METLGYYGDVLTDIVEELFEDGSAGFGQKLCLLRARTDVNEWVMIVDCFHKSNILSVICSNDCDN